MGGRPLFALNLVFWNSGELAVEQLDELLAGAADVAAENGFVIVGGHTVDDPEPKFGLSVTGEVHPDRILRNSALRDGDVLVLSKPLGTGIVATAAKAGQAGDAAVEAMVASMCRSNAAASAVALDAGATGATDVTGFGLLGHLGQMARTSAIDVTLDVASVPLLPEARDLAGAGYVPGGTRRNLDWVRERLDADGVDDTTLLLLADAQTSGGLVFGVAPENATSVMTALVGSGHDCAEIGRVRHGDGTLRLR
jgi:selenide,water dikinase